MQLRLSILVSVALFCSMTFAIPIDTLQAYRRDSSDMLQRSEYIEARETDYDIVHMARKRAVKLETCTYCGTMV